MVKTIFVSLTNPKKNKDHEARCYNVHSLKYFWNQALGEHESY